MDVWVNGWVTGVGQVRSNLGLIDIIQLFEDL